VGSQVTVVRAGGGTRGATLVALGPMRLGIGRGMAEKIMVAVEHRTAKTST
jgi:Fe2+ transport system protein FeoA